MKLDGLFEHEFDKLQLKKVRLKTDPKKPLLEYEGYILKEDRKFLKMHEGILSKIGHGYQKVLSASQKLKALGQGDIGVLAKNRAKKRVVRRKQKGTSI